MTVIARNVYDPYVAPFDGAPGGGIVCDKGVTKQADKDGCDINLIMKRFEKTGVLPDLIKQNPVYGDFSSVPDFQSALEIVRKAETQFAALDPQIRSRFDNSAEAFLAFATDPANAAEMVKMGLKKASDLPKKADPDPETAGGKNPARDRSKEAAEPPPAP